MTEFQKEISVIVVLLAFSLGYFCYVEIAPTGITRRGVVRANEKVLYDENSESIGFKDCIRF